MKTETDRIIFLDYLRVIACFMVVMVHACEFYYCNEAGAILANDTDRLWVSLIDGAFRQSVPLFVMASSFLLVPLTTDATTFFKRRFSRVLVPFIVWSLLYAAVPLILVGYAFTAGLFYTHSLESTDYTYVEQSWYFCTFNVAMMTAGTFLLLRHAGSSARWLYTPVKTVSKLSYGIYLMHIFILGFMQQWIAPHFPTLPAILLVGTATFLACILVTRLISLLPFSKWIIG